MSGTKARSNMIFLTDSSGSIGLDNFKKSLELARQIVQSLGTGSGLKLALLTFATRTRLVCGLTSDKEQFFQCLEKARYQASTSNLHLGIDQARALAQVDDPGARTTITVLTDGRPDNSSLACGAAGRAKDEGYTIISVGIGNDPDENQLQCMSSGYIYRVQEDTDLAELGSVIAQVIYNDIDSSV